MRCWPWRGQHSNTGDTSTVHCCQDSARLGAETEVEVDMAADEPSLDLDLDMYREMAAEARRAAHRLCGLTEVVFIPQYNVNLK